MHIRNIPVFLSSHLTSLIGGELLSCRWCFLYLNACWCWSALDSDCESRYTFQTLSWLLSNSFWKEITQDTCKMGTIVKIMDGNSNLGPCCHLHALFVGRAFAIDFSINQLRIWHNLLLNYMFLTGNFVSYGRCFSLCW